MYTVVEKVKSTISNDCGYEKKDMFRSKDEARIYLATRCEEIQNSLKDDLVDSLIGTFSSIFRTSCLNINVKVVG